jgi:quercetin dioxygenase-like cupin family protein
MRVNLELHEIHDWSSKGVVMQELLRQDDPPCRTHIAHYHPGAVLGRHSGGLWQLFAVLDGSGWVSGEEETKQHCTDGDAFVWPPGESHASGSDTGMTVVIVQSNQPIRH